jgi:hypothetical protein
MIAACPVLHHLDLPRKDTAETIDMVAMVDRSIHRLLTRKTSIGIPQGISKIDMGRPTEVMEDFLVVEKDDGKHLLAATTTHSSSRCRTIIVRSSTRSLREQAHGPLPCKQR